MSDGEDSMQSYRVRFVRAIFILLLAVAAAGALLVGLAHGVDGVAQALGKREPGVLRGLGLVDEVFAHLSSLATARNCS